MARRNDAPTSRTLTPEALLRSPVAGSLRDAVEAAGSAVGANAQQRGSASAAQGRRRLVLLLTLLLYGFGLVMVASATSGTSLLASGDAWQYTRRQALFGAGGIAVMLLVMRIPIGAVRRFTPLLLGISVAMLGLAFVPGISETVNGASRWVTLAGFTFQPSEFAKVAVVLFVAAHLAVNRPPVGLTWPALRGSSLLVGFGVAGVIFLQRDLGTATVTAAVVVALHLLAGMRWKLLLAVTLGSAGLVMVGILSEEFRRQRFLAFLDPFADPHGAGFQLVQGQVAIGSGGPLGVGLGGSVQKIRYVPEAHTDMIYAIIAEELGFVGVLVVLASFAALAVVGLRCATAARTRYESLLAAGLTLAICGQAMLNVAGVVGVMPLTGITLPLVSYGGSSLLVTFAALGLLANVAGRGHDVADEPASTDAVDGSRVG